MPVKSGTAVNLINFAWVCAVLTQVRIRPSIARLPPATARELGLKLAHIFCTLCITIIMWHSSAVVRVIHLLPYKTKGQISVCNYFKLEFISYIFVSAFALYNITKIKKPCKQVEYFNQHSQSTLRRLDNR